MTQKQLETCLDGEINIVNPEGLRLLIEFASSYLQKGRYGACLKIMGDEKGYRFVAYPGPAVVEKGRAEHKPLHFHVKHPQYEELRILTEDFSEMDGILVPKRLRMVWGVGSVRNYLTKQTKSVYETGKLKE